MEIDTLLNKKRDIWIRKAQKQQLFFPQEMKEMGAEKIDSSYIIMIDGIKGLQLPPLLIGKKYELKLGCTMYHKQYGLIGRTYMGQAVPLNSVGTVYQGQSKDYFLLTTSLSNEDLELVVELLAYEVLPPNLPIKSTIFTVGWTTLPMPRDKKKHVAPIYEGSPRLLYFKNTTRTILQSCSIDFQGSFITMPPGLLTILPNNCVCGPSDSFPGIIGEHLPSEALDVIEADYKARSALHILPTCSIFVNKCLISSEENFEEILKTLFKSAMQADEVEIKERRMKVAAHNKWKYLNSNKLKNSIIMYYERGWLACNGIMNVDNVFLCDGQALVFQLEYIFLYTKGKTEETKSLIVAELVHLLKFTNSLRQFEEEEFAVEMCFDITKSITESRLWCPQELINDPTNKLVIHCNVSSKMVPGTEEKTKALMAKYEEQKKIEKLKQTAIKEQEELDKRKALKEPVKKEQKQLKPEKEEILEENIEFVKPTRIRDDMISTIIELILCIFSSTF